MSALTEWIRRGRVVIYVCPTDSLSLNRIMCVWVRHAMLSRSPSNSARQRRGRGCAKRRCDHPAVDRGAAVSLGIQRFASWRQRRQVYNRVITRAALAHGGGGARVRETTEVVCVMLRRPGVLSY